MLTVLLTFIFLMLAPALAFAADAVTATDGASLVHRIVHLLTPAQWIGVGYALLNVLNALLPHAGSTVGKLRSLLDRLALLTPQTQAGTFKLPGAVSVSPTLADTTNLPVAK